MDTYAHWLHFSSYIYVINLKLCEDVVQYLNRLSPEFGFDCELVSCETRPTVRICLFSGLARYILHIPATARSFATKFGSRVKEILVRHLSEFNVDRWPGRVVIAPTRYTIVEASPPSVSIFLLLPSMLSEVLLTAGILCHIITCASSRFLSFRSSEYSGFGSVTILVSVLCLFWFPFCDLQNFGH